MRKTFTLILVATLIAAAASLTSCSAGPADEPYVKNAVVTWVELEGGFWALVTTPDSDMLDPMNPLPQEFREDRLAVKIWYIPRKDMNSIHMWGRVIDLRRIERTRPIE